MELLHHLWGVEVSARAFLIRALGTSDFGDPSGKRSHLCGGLLDLAAVGLAR